MCTRMTSEWKMRGFIASASNILLYLPTGEPGQLPGEEADETGTLFPPQDIVFSLHRLKYELFSAHNHFLDHRFPKSAETRK